MQRCGLTRKTMEVFVGSQIPYEDRDKLLQLSGGRRASAYQRHVIGGGFGEKKISPVKFMLHYWLETKRL
jgi:hypothetical protein